MDFDEIEDVDLWQRQIYVSLSSNQRGLCSKRTLIRRGDSDCYVAVGTPSRSLPRAGVSGRNSIVYRAFAGSSGATVQSLLPKEADIFDD